MVAADRALLCVALTLAHLIFGPCLLGADILALFMLYSVIVYGNPKNTKAFIILALTIGLLASALIAWTMTNGPLLTGGKDAYMEQLERPKSE